MKARGKRRHKNMKSPLCKIDLSVPLPIQTLGNAVVLSWNDPWFALQSAPAATGAYTNILGATSPYTNSMVGPQRFFLLIGN